MYDVQQTLFDAYKDPARFTDALQKVADILTAATSFFLTLDGADVKDIFFSSGTDADLKTRFDLHAFDGHFIQIFQRLASGRSLLLYSEDLREAASDADWSELAQRQVSSLMLVPVLNSDQKPVGILGGINMKRRWSDSTPLECVVRNFLMALDNMTFYRQIERMSMIDSLTGLQNRNCYENSLDSYAKSGADSLCCLYIDANGLHELNNTLGHTAGDAMLICIGDSLKTFFPSQHCYRIGGDEFVAFCLNCTQEEVARYIDQLNERMAAFDYHISIGQAWASAPFDMAALVTTAEQKMYEVKRLYYQQAGDLSKARVMHQKLERILLEKKDSDAFLEVIASRFMGTYMVDMKTDQVRVIYQPSYFSRILKEQHYHFMPSMQLYAQDYVAVEDQAAFLRFLDYDHIRQQLQTSHIIKYDYRKQDGTKLVLRIYPTRDYGPEQEEVIWMFEEDSN